LIVPLGLIALAASRCTSAQAGPPDSGFSDASFDVAPLFDASPSDAATCGPADVSGYQPPALTPPNPPHQNKCSTQQIDDYAQCQGADDQALCKQFADGQSGQTCRECIETQSTDPRWGVIVFTGSNGVYDIAGCVDDALGEVSDEKASGGTGSCGDLLFASFGCQLAACGACKGSAFDTCASDVVDSACQAFDMPVESSSGPCADLFGDAAPSDASSCFPDGSITDPIQHQVDWLQRIVGYMCGP
jgi:hypothetical protein